MKDFIEDAIPIYKRRTVEYDFSLYYADRKRAAQLDADDVVRFKVYSAAGQVPLANMDLTSTGRTANKSGIAILTLGNAETNTPAKVRVTFAQADVEALTVGTYLAEILIVDGGSTNPANAARPVTYGKVKILDTALGNIGP